MLPDNAPSPGIQLPESGPRRGPGAKILMFLGIAVMLFFAVFAWASWRSNRQSDQEAHDLAAIRTASKPALNNRAQILRENGVPESQVLEPSAANHPAVQQPPPQQQYNPAAFIPVTPPPAPSVPPAITAELERRKAEYAWRLASRDSVDFHHVGQQAQQPLRLPVPPNQQLAQAAVSPDYPQMLRNIAQSARSQRAGSQATPNLAALLSGTGAGQGAAGEPSSDEHEAAETQAQKADFLKPENRKAADYLSAQRETPRSLFELVTGTNIPAILMENINSDLPGETKAMITQDVNNSACAVTQPDGQRTCFVMIPARSMLTGTYNSTVAYGQNRLQVVWNRLRFPDSSFLDLEKMNSHDTEGSAGLNGKTDNHLKRLIAGAALTSILAAGFQLSQNRSNTNTFNYPSAGQVVAGAVGQEASRLGNQVTSRNLNIQPTIKISAGKTLNVFINKDIAFEGFWKLNEHGALVFVEMK